jgi:hypothetical protein
MKKLERLNSDKFASYKLEAESMFSIVGATPPVVDGPGGGTYSGGTTTKQVATTCNLGFSHSGADIDYDESPIDVDQEPVKE